jgi:hypothetical protein
MLAKVYQDERGNWRWSLAEDSGEVIAESPAKAKYDKEAVAVYGLVLATGTHLKVSEGVMRLVSSEKETRWIDTEIPK